jgi:hypothetical protein
VFGQGERSSLEELDRLHVELCAKQVEMLRAVARAELEGSWQNSGARDLPHFLSMRYGISQWKARRWVAAAHALPSLPDISHALAVGQLSLDKVVELTRFADFETEGSLVVWARRVSAAAIRRRADLMLRRELRETKDAERSRFLSWWFLDDEARLGLEAELPAAQGAVVVRALERLTETIPVMPGEGDPSYASARRADALVALASARLSQDPDQDRATVVVHASLEAIVQGEGVAEIEGGPVVHAEVARRLSCNARIQLVAEDEAGGVRFVSQTFREPPAWMMRQLRYRDRGCVFPGCGTQRFTVAHHVVWWAGGGATSLDNLVLLCSFHHRLLHEHGWSLNRGRDGDLRWVRADGALHHPGPAPPDALRRPKEPQPMSDLSPGHELARKA